jgi:spoIIIJ-associated protein
MEWVETTGKTIIEAKEAALDELGVDEQDAEFEVLQEPKAGLFGLLRTEGRVRARVRPSTPRAKEDRRDRRRRNRTSSSSESSSAESPAGGPVADAPEIPVAATSPLQTDTADPAGESTSRPARSRARRRTPGPAPVPDDVVAEPVGDASPAAEVTPDLVDVVALSSDRPARAAGPRRARRADTTNPSPRHLDDIDDHRTAREGTDMDVALEDQGTVATEFLQGLVEGFGLVASIDVSQPDDDTLSIQLSGNDLGLLIGPKGATLLSIQDLTRTVVQRRTGAGNGRIYVDVSGYRQKRGEALARFTHKVAADVQASRQRVALEPMSAPDRKVVHDTVTAIEGVTTVSEGEEPRRRVVILPVED